MNACRPECVQRAHLRSRAKRAPLHRALPWLLATALVAGVVLPCHAQSARKPFSADESARLAAHELVTRPVEERRGTLRLIGGSSWQVVDARPDAVWRAMNETKYYARMLPAVSAATLVNSEPDLRRVKLAHKLGPLGIAYRLAFKFDQERRDITFKLNDPLDSGLRAAWGFITVHPYGASRSLIAYGVMADPGDGLLVGIARKLVHTWLLRVPWTVMRFVEGPTGQKLYGSRPARGCRGVDGGHPQKCAP